MSTIKTAIKNILTEALFDVPPAIHQEYIHQFSPSFINYIKFNENNIRKGYDSKKNKWYPISSVEGGLPTIGYGHKLKTGENFSKGISEDEAIRLLNNDLNIARETAKREVDQKYGLGIFQHLTLDKQEMLTDFVFNLGSLRSFPKFTRAVLTNDVNTMMKEYKRYVGGRELTQRNRTFYTRYLADAK